jgi:uncharacterized protein YqeY
MSDLAAMTEQRDALLRDQHELKQEMRKLAEDKARLDWLEQHWSEFDPLDAFVPYPTDDGALRGALDQAMARTAAQKPCESCGALGKWLSHGQFDRLCPDCGGFIPGSTATGDGQDIGL